MNIFQKINGALTSVAKRGVPKGLDDEMHLRAYQANLMIVYGITIIPGFSIIGFIEGHYLSMALNFLLVLLLITSYQLIKRGYTFWGKYFGVLSAILLGFFPAWADGFPVGYSTLFAAFAGLPFLVFGKENNLARVSLIRQPAGLKPPPFRRVAFS